MTKLIKVNIIYGDTPSNIFEQEIKIAEFSTVLQALNKSNLSLFFADLDYQQLGYANYSEEISLDYQLKQGDRIEILRAITANPKELRELKALRQQQKNKK